MATLRIIKRLKIHSYMMHSLLVLLLLGICICSAIDSEPINGSSSSIELKSLLMDSIRNISTYTYLINISGNIEITSDNFLNESNSTIISSEEGVVNLTGAAISATQKSQEISENYGTISTTNELYILNKTQYKRHNDEWSRINLENPREMISKRNIIYNESNIINNSYISLLGFEKIDGEDCYRIEVIPSKKDTELMLNLSIENIKYKNLPKQIETKWISWITKQNHYLKRNDIKIGFIRKSEDLGDSSQNKDRMVITYRVVSKYNDYNQPAFINFSKDFHVAYPFPIGDASTKIFGVVQDDSATNEYPYENNKIIYIDIATMGHFIVDLIDIDDRYYKSKWDSRSDSRSFLIFELPNGTIIKKIRFEPDNYYQQSGSPFSFDLRLNQLGSINIDPINYGGFNGSDNRIKLEIYTLKQKYNNYDSSDKFLVDLAIDLKLTNIGENEISLNTDDFSLIDQFGWKYAAENDQSNLGLLLPGESRRFDIVIPDVSILSSPLILEYKSLRVNVR